MGKQWGILGANQIAGPIFNVLFPTFSSIQNDRKIVRDAYFKAFKYVNLITIPLALGTIMVAPEFVTFILGEKWTNMIPILQIFCVYGMFFAAGIPSASIFIALGKVKLAAKITAVQAAFILVFIYPSLLWQGTTGVALCITVGMILIYFLIKSMLACSILDTNFLELIKHIKGTTIASILMCSSIIMTKMLLGSSFYTLFIFIFVGVFIYFLSIYLIEREIFIELKKLFSTFKK